MQLTGGLGLANIQTKHCFFKRLSRNLVVLSFQWIYERYTPLLDNLPHPFNGASQVSTINKKKCSAGVDIQLHKP